jgi:hypothetical protein
VPNWNTAFFNKRCVYFLRDLFARNHRCSAQQAILSFFEKSKRPGRMARVLSPGETRLTVDSGRRFSAAGRSLTRIGTSDKMAFVSQSVGP